MATIAVPKKQNQIQALNWSTRILNDGIFFFKPGKKFIAQIQLSIQLISF